MVFVDRVSGQPNRYALTTEDGNKYYVTLERADNPITEGTPLNAETFNDMTYEIQEIIDANDRRYESWMNGKDALYIESTEFPGCYYRMVGSEKEWVNPPMVPGEEYRTTERKGGITVYTQCTNTLLLPARGEAKRIALGTNFNYRGLVSVSGFAYDSVTDTTYLLPFVSNYGDEHPVKIYFQDSELVIERMDTVENIVMQIEIILKYTGYA